MNRIFKKTNEVGEDMIYIIPMCEIEKKFNCYGLYHTTNNYDNDDIIKIGKHYKIEFNVSTKIEEILKSQFPKWNDDNYFIIVDSFEKAEKVISIINLEHCDDDDAWKDANIDLIEFDGQNLNNVKSEDYYVDTYEYESYHDGSNFKEIILRSDNFEVEFEEITNDLGEDFEDNLVHIYSSEYNQGNAFSIYVHYDTKSIFKCERSCWQGSYRNYYIEITGDELDYIKVEYFPEERLISFFPEFIEKYGNNLIAVNDIDIDAISIISNNDIIKIASNSKNSKGSILYKHNDGRYVIHYWSCYQGDKDGWYILDEYDAREYIDEN